MRFQRSTLVLALVLGAQALVICAAPLTTLFAQSNASDPNAKLPFDPAVRRGTLPNGLQYFIRQNNYPEHRAEFRLVVKAGSVLEDNDQQGLAHFNEHMAFNGTEKFPGNDLPSFLESHGVKFGAHVNAYTSFDETVYRFTLPTDKALAVDTGLMILSEWAHNVKFDTKEIDKERGVVGEEWRLGLGAGERIRNKEFPIVLKGSDYANRLPIGLKPVIDTAHYDRVSSFYHDWYRPDLMAVVVVGDVDPNEIEREIKSDFGALQNPANERPRRKVDIPAHTEEYVSVSSDKELTGASFNYGFIRPDRPIATVADFQHEILGDIYDEMLNARLEEIQSSANPPFVFARAADQTFLGDHQEYSIFGSLKPDAIQDGITRLLQELYRVRQYGFTAAELERAKESVMSESDSRYNERAKMKSDEFANEYVQYVLIDDASPGIDFEHQIATHYIPSVTLAEVNALTAERLDHASPVLTLRLPEANANAVTESGLLATLHGVQNTNLDPYKEEAVASALMDKLPTPGTVVSEKKIEKIGVTEWTLSNGARVVLKPTDFKDDEILFTAVAPGGTSLSPDNDFVSASQASGIVDASGVGSLAESTLQKMMMGKKVRVTPFVGGLSSGIQGSSAKKDLESMFQLVHLYASEPRMDTATAKGFLSRLESMLKNRDKNPQSAFSDTLTATLSNYHPRSAPLTIDRLHQIKLSTAYDFYRSRFQNGRNFTYFFVGSFDPATMKPLVERYIGSLPAGNKEQWKDLGIEPPKGVIKKVVHKGLEPKSSVRLVFTGPFEWSQQNRYNLQAMSEALAIKLREDLREDKSGVYGIGVSASPTKHPKGRYSLSISFGCDPKRVDELVGEVLKQIDTVTTKPIEAIYVEKVKATNKRDFETSLKENNYWMTVLQTYDWNGEDPTSIFARTQLIDALTPETVMQTAKKYFDRNNYIQVTLMPEKS